MECLYISKDRVLTKEVQKQKQANEEIENKYFIKSKKLEEQLAEAERKNKDRDEKIQLLIELQELTAEFDLEKDPKKRLEIARKMKELMQEQSHSKSH